MPYYLKLRPKERISAPGSSPGTFLIHENALPSKITLYAFNSEFYEEKELDNTADLFSEISISDRYYWIDVKGLGSKEVLEKVSDYFGINKLELEDIVTLNQRPKLEEKEDHLFTISRMIELDKSSHISNEQLSIFNFSHFVITFQENYEDLLNPVRTRLRNGKGNIRMGGPMYLTYAIIDNIIDNYYPVMQDISDRLDDIEERLLKNPTKKMMFEIQDIKRALLLIKRGIWPEKEKMIALLRSNSPLIGEQTKMYLNDVNDHCIQVIDTVESLREISSGLMDLYLSNISNRTNEVMKVLTVISAIFIPLTFIVGIYGMNFAPVNPITNKPLTWNMPELYSPYGYMTCMLVMLLIALVQLFLFNRKGWLK